ncbi:MAG: 8-oxo-dGTP diphosphatase [Anaerolineae bacterium]|nr:8-oxo-dGTP diphosphatase [Anaerolineae bacterium]
MPYTPILATLGYIVTPDRENVLLIHRNTRPDDAHFGKYNGLGGKLDRHEHMTAGMKRELFEEAGIEVTALHLRGMISWPGFGKYGEDWLGFIYLITDWTGTLKTRNDEGELVWVSVSTLLTPDALNLWPGDRYFLPLVFDADPRQFHGVMPYVDGQPAGWVYERI